MQKQKEPTFTRAMIGKSLLSLLEYLPYPAWIYCADGRYQWINDSFLKLLNATREDLINKTNPDFIPPDLASKCANSKQQVLEERCSLTFHFEEKKYRNIVYKTPIFSDDGEIIAVTGLLLDLTQGMGLEIQLNNLKDFYHSLLSNMGEALFYVNKNGVFEFINPKAKEFLAECKFQGPLYDFNSWAKYFPKRYDRNGKRLSKDSAIFKRALKGEIILNEEVGLETAKGLKRTFCTSAIPFRSKEDGSILSVIMTTKDITQEKQLIDALAKKTKLVEQRNQELHQFAYSAAHDLRDPLRNISLSASLIHEKIKTQEYDGIEDLLERLLKTASYGSSLVKNLLNYSAANCEMQMEPISLDEVARQTIAVLSNLIDRAKAKIIFTKLPTVLGNQQQLQIVFQNIITNAIRYKGNNPLEISISAHRKKSLWVISIKDNGPGVNPEFKDEIFLPFKRLNPNNATGRSSGLGLSICRRIIEQHGGEIWLDTHSSPGACFKFTLKEPLHNIAKLA